MANYLDIVAIAIVNKGAIVGRMILGTKSRFSIVLTAGGNSRIVKRFDSSTIGCGESDVTFRDRTLRDPEIRPIRSEADRFFSILLKSAEIPSNAIVSLAPVRAVRRNAARTRANNSRGLNGLVT